MARWTIVIAATLVLSACGGQADPGGQPLPGPTPSPSPGSLRFVLDESYTVGESVDVVLANDTDTTYVFNSTGYEACYMTYTDETGREFIIPPGTHCDLIVYEDLSPGASATLFTWGLDECTKDNWGCARSRPLKPGTYTIAGSFEPKDGGAKTPVEATLEIVAAG